MFLVEWKGYPKEQATWEPIEHMIFLKDYQRYYQHLKKKYAHKIKRKNN